ncbi:hypothetical protein EMIHUDRAFT_115545 [Emiliania huxleyi CCMP1516]|uniref:Uncharacterized protein n=2 Tax=Emiliania huxleyi TaxID=2903 RepID=A0A0D3JPK0_EMIH1|nr:hypothetical protein EMIHUDRAFT_115545 [Emiliania huxleyi CCMP1516]EOD25435.1 hypothetical protein EMIHUDRAFT_115545 [Emiliania huxleyi CCMP1516]|eukprot:XP_005777864.1 hypothetical protein EMIHUDRAFT_115545 [Emiliania huxleyi CCMP1516]
MRAPSRSSDAHSLFGMASAALAEAISDASRSPASLLGVGSLALVPSPLSARLFKAVAAELSQAAPQPVLPSPPLPLLRLWYGSRHVERLAVSAADDDWAVEVGGCSALPSLSSLDLPGARLTAHGAAHLAAGLRALTHLRIADCHGLGAAGFGVLCGGCLQLVSLQLPNCKIALDAAAVRTMVDRLAGLTALDLGGNLLASAAVPPLCSAPLRLLRVWGSATALGLQCVSLGLASRLADLSLAHAALLPGDLARCTSLASSESLTSLTLSGTSLSAADLAAAASPPGLTSLDLSCCCVEAAAALRVALCAARRLERLLLDRLECACRPPQHRPPGGAPPVAQSPAPLRELRLSGCPSLGPPLWPSAPLSLEVLDLSGGETPFSHLLPPGPPASPPVRLPALRLLLLADCRLTDADARPISHLCPRLEALDLSGNPLLSDAAVLPLAALRRTLRSLALERLPLVTAHALAALRALPLQTLELRGSSVPPDEAEASLGIARRAAERAAERARRAAAATARLRAVQTEAERSARAAHRARGKVRYSVEALLALRQSPLARAPGRPTASVVDGGGGGGAAAALLLRRAPFGSAACGAPWEDRAEVLWEQGSGGWEEPERGGALEEGLAGANGGGEEREESDC